MLVGEMAGANEDFGSLQTRNTDMGSDMTWYRTSYRKNWISCRYPYWTETLLLVSFRKCFWLLKYCVQFFNKKQNVSCSIGFISEVCPNIDPLCLIFQLKKEVSSSIGVILEKKVSVTSIKKK
jgi:hypothetical protein